MPIAKNAAAISAATCPASIGPRSFPARAAELQGRPYRAPCYGLPGRQLSIIAMATARLGGLAGCAGVGYGMRFAAILMDGRARLVAAGFRAVQHCPDPG